MKVHKAQVGETIKLSSILWGGYAGMVSPTVFSITLPKLGNYYYPINSETIIFYGRKFKVIKVNEQEIEIQELQF